MAFKKDINFNQPINLYTVDIVIYASGNNSLSISQ